MWDIVLLKKMPVIVVASGCVKWYGMDNGAVGGVNGDVPSDFCGRSDGPHVCGVGAGLYRWQWQLNYGVVLSGACNSVSGCVLSSIFFLRLPLYGFLKLAMILIHYIKK